MESPWVSLSILVSLPFVETLETANLRETKRLHLLAGELLECCFVVLLVVGCELRVSFALHLQLPLLVVHLEKQRFRRHLFLL